MQIFISFYIIFNSKKQVVGLVKEAFIAVLASQDTHDECAKHGKVVHVTVDPRGTAGETVKPWSQWGGNAHLSLQNGGRFHNSWKHWKHPNGPTDSPETMTPQSVISKF